MRIQHVIIAMGLLTVSGAASASAFGTHDGTVAEKPKQTAPAPQLLDNPCLPSRPPRRPCGPPT
jgi:hypothetical protein